MTKVKKRKIAEPIKNKPAKAMPRGIKAKVKSDSAEWTYKRMAQYIQEFEETLDDEHEVGARLVTTDSGMSFHIEDMGYWGPDIITFEGVNSNMERIKLIQHVSQMNVLLIAMAKQNTTEPKAPPRRIGFNLDRKLKK